MSKKIWGDLLTEKGYLIVPRELRLKRRELGLNNEEYAILLDYLDHFKHSGTESPYQCLAELNGVTERTIQRRLGTLEKKGLLRREVRIHTDGRIKSVVFSPEPLVRKLESLVADDVASAGAGLGNEYPANIRSAHEPKAHYESQAIEGQEKIKEKKWKDKFCSTRWYNEVFSEMYEEASGQPVLTGGREYKSAEVYFGRLRELNPDLSAEAIFIRAAEGARYMLDSQLRGGVFGWLHKPPDICMLANQAQAVDYQLRTIERVYGKGSDKAGNEYGVKLSFTTKDKEEENASEQIERVYDELRGIEQPDVRGGFPQSLRSGIYEDKSQEAGKVQKAHARGSQVFRKCGKH
ncbi:MAG: winged helix-turn-helix transcriptional regulator [Deltaproteobacteria bacterium]|nr:winged helix-turn-helix transcriptional regulator [Deltaproteobacteria bacterium]